eukprot:scaffold94713_cov23-Cyclotella_meneghiniana.AAC.2
MDVMGRLGYYAFLIVDMTMVEIPVPVNRPSGEEQSRPPHNTPKARWPPKKSRGARSGKKVLTNGEAPPLRPVGDRGPKSRQGGAKREAPWARALRGNRCLHVT